MRALWQMPELQEIWNHIETGETPVTVTGLSPVHRAQLAAALRLRSGRPLLMLCSDEREVQRQAVGVPPAGSAAPLRKRRVRRRDDGRGARAALYPAAGA